MANRIYRYFPLWLIMFSLMAFPFAVRAQSNMQLIKPGSIWKYNDLGTDLGTFWRSGNYSDVGWKEGRAILGYGDNDLGTEIGFGNDQNNKHSCYYFRKSININSLDGINSIIVSVLRDDGAAVYINGQLVVSSNMPESFSHHSLASVAIGAESARKFYTYSIGIESLKMGKNIIAVEVHQASVLSSDVSFDLMLEISAELPRIVIINEIIAQNHSAYLDPSTNQFLDCIELKNVSDADVDLSGFYLSDSKSNFKKWEIPPGTVIGAGDLAVFFADGTDTLNYTNFKLDRNGELLGLYDLNGSPYDQIDYPTQAMDISYGRNSSNFNELMFFGDATIGEENGSGNEILNFAPTVLFSEVGGKYDHDIDLMLSGATAEGSIRYTLNGNTPKYNSTRFTGAIKIDQTTVVKARVFEPGSLAGKVITQTYFINENIDLPIMSISTEDDYLYDSRIGIYLDENVSTRKPWERPATLEFIESDGSKVLDSEVDIRLFGRGAIRFPEKSLAIFARDNQGKDFFDVKLFPQLNLDHFNSFLLRSSSDDWRYTLFRDGMIQSAIQKELSLDVQSYRACIVFLNGEYMGIHNIREKYNESYLADHHGVDPNNLDLLFIDNDYSPSRIEIMSGDIGAYKTLLNYINNTDLSVAENFALVEQLMDVDNFIDYIIVQVISSNKSWRHNRRIWRPKTPTGKFQWLTFDLDYGYSLVDLDILKTIGKDDPILAGLLQNADFRNKLITRILIADQSVFHPDRMVALIDSLEQGIEDQINRHLDRWGGSWEGMITSKDDWRTKVQIMRNYALNRSPYTRQHLTTFFQLNGFVDGKMNVIPEGAGSIIVNQSKGLDSDFDGKFAKGEQIQLLAESNAGYHFVGWNAEISAYNAIAEGSEWKYLDNGSNQGVVWKDDGFDDSSWETGNANLGFGNENNTILEAGHVTYYFRKSFEITDIADISGASISLLRDDGALIYINGNEVVRSNMPEGSINFQTLASSMAGWVEERTYYNYNLSLDHFIEGTNYIAVEVHQDVINSNDLSFDLSLDLQTDGLLNENPITTAPSEQFEITANFSKTSESGIVISEIAYNQPDELGGDAGSFIELTNISKKPIDLAGYAFTSGISFVFPGGTVIKASERVLLVKDIQYFSTVNGTIFQWTDGTLSKSGETIRINSPSGDIIDECSYLVVSPWPEISNTKYGSIELNDLSADNSLGANWGNSLGTGGSANLVNSLVFRNIKINEIQANPLSIGYLGSTDWIEIYNGSQDAIDIADLYLSDDELEPWKWKIRSGFPEITTLQPEGFILIQADKLPELGILHADFRLSGDGGSVILSLGSPGRQTIIDELSYDLQEDGLSIGRIPDGSEEWVSKLDPTPLQANMPKSDFIVTPHSIKVGDWLPIYVKVYQEDGLVDFSFHGVKTLTAGNATIEPDTIRFTKGVGYALVQVISGNEIEVRVDGLDDVSFVKVLGNKPVVELASTYNTNLTLVSGTDYLIKNGLTIEEHGSLTIESGVHIRLGDQANIIAKAPVKIYGSKTLPVVFMPDDPESHWGGLEIREHDGLSELSHTFFFRGGSDPDRLFFHTETQAVVRSSYADISMDNCYIFNNQGKGFGSEEAIVQISDCLFATSPMGPEFRLSFSKVDKTWIVDIPDPDKNRDGNDNDGIYFWKEINEQTPPSEFTNGVIANIEDDAIDMLASDLLVKNTLFLEILDKAASCGYWTEARFERCLVIDCNAGIVPGWWSDAKVIQTTFYDTNRPVKNSLFGATEVWNSILYDFYDVAWNDDVSNEPIFYYSISDSKELPGENNMVGNPLFVDAKQFNFQLQASSPAIDAGDPSFPTDPDGSIADLGIFPFKGSTNSELVLNEIYYNVPKEQGVDEDFEFIEFFNPGVEPINISGYHIANGISFTFPAETILGGGEYIVVTSKVSSYSHLDCQVFDWGSEKLSNSTETIELFNKSNELLASVTYLDQLPWSPLADGQGYSLELRNPLLDVSQSENWRNSYKMRGTPGAINAVPDYSKLHLNEILARNTNTIRDDQDEYVPWIEIYNASDNDIDITGLIIKDELTNTSHQIGIGDYATINIPSGGYTLLYLDGLPEGGIFHTALVPNPSGGTYGLYHYGLDGQELVPISELSYPLAIQDYSWGRYPNGSEEFLVFDIPTPGSSNARISEQIIVPKLYTTGEDIPLIIRKVEEEVGLESINGIEDIDIEQTNTIVESVELSKGFGFKWITPEENQSLKIRFEEDSIAVDFDSYRPSRIRSEKILRSQIWTSEYDYHILSALNIPADATLVIEAGTRIFVKKYANITVQGQIEIRGNKLNPVTFLPLDEENPWGGLQIQEGAGEVMISHAFFIGGGNGIRLNNGLFDDQAMIESMRPVIMNNVYIIGIDGKAIHVKDSKLELYNSVIYDCKSGIELENSIATIDNSHILFLPGSWSSGTDANQDAISAFGYSGSQEGQISISNSFVYQIADDGLSAVTQFPVHISSSYFGDIGDKAIGIKQASTNIDFSIIESSGTGIELSEAVIGKLDHVTFYNLTTPIRMQHSNAEIDPSSLKVSNSIFARSHGDDYSLSGEAEVSFEYNLSTQEAFSGIGNIQGEPHFFDASNSDFHLVPGSPAINSGDPDYIKDSDGSNTDMGRYGMASYSTSVEPIFTEIYYKPSASSTAGKFVELYNPGLVEISLSGFQIGGDIGFLFPASATLEAGNYVIITDSPEHYQGTVQNVFTWTSGDLIDEEGHIQLFNPEGELADEVNYNISSLWSKWPNGKGTSLELRTTGYDNALETSWRSSYYIGGTPGKDNVVPPQQGIVINEFMARNASTYPDEFDQISDWIELYNSADYFVSLEDYFITRDLSNQAMHQLVAMHSDSLFVPPNGFFTVHADELDRLGVKHISFVLSGSGGEIGLFKKNPKEYIQEDKIVYSEQKTDVSFGRVIDGSDSWIAFSEPSPNRPNGSDAPRIEGIFINEFMARNSSVHANNLGEFDDWIEVYNDNDFAVDLGGLYVTDRSDELDYFQISELKPDSTTVPAKGFLMLYPSGNSRLGVTHTSFQLAGSGEYIAISQVYLGKLEIVDEITYDSQTTDISYGRNGDGSSDWILFTEPTPLKSNKTSGSGDLNSEPESSIIVFPNPVSELINIQINHVGSSEVSMWIHNSFGEIEYYQNWNELFGSSGRIEKQWTAKQLGLKSGLYVINILIGDQILTKRIIVL